jgi:hypothetical protein
MSNLADLATNRQRLWGVVLLIATCSMPLASLASGPHPADGTTTTLVRAAKRFEERLGLHETSSFERQSNEGAVDYRCYFTGKLELPEDYRMLRLKRGSPRGCKVDARKYDVFFYPLQAMASPKTPITISLAHSSPERVLMVVPHEDFHQDQAISGLPAPLAEAAATLVGFLAARDIARSQFGTKSEVYRNLSMDPELFLRKSRLVNSYFDKVHQLYEDYSSMRLSKAKALAGKAQLFYTLERQCERIKPGPKSFNRCLAVNNNAGLAFDHSYTRYYPLVYGVAKAKGEDLRATIDALGQAAKAQSQSQAIERLSVGSR